MKDIILKAKEENRHLYEYEAKELLKSNGLEIPSTEIAKSEEEAVKFSDAMGYPVVMKIVSPQIIHKTDAGGVKVNIKNVEEARNAYKAIIENAQKYDSNAEIHGILVTPMVPQGTEIIIGMIRDEVFGPTVMFGIGGVFVEVFKDVNFRVAPISKQDATEMIEEIKAYPLLKGVRGEKAKDIDALVNVIVKVSEIAEKYDDIKEIDLNPVFAYEDGLAIVDARILI